MTKIKDLISINGQAILPKGVQLARYGNPEKVEENNRLAVGYVFGSSPTRKIGNYTEASSLTIFENIREAFNNPATQNIFTVIAKYGHGKSHFAVVLANYFGLAPDSPVLANLIQNIETCSDKITADQFRHFKNAAGGKPHLVITLAGHEIQDLRQGFLKALRRALNACEATRNYSIKSVSVAKANWLRTREDDLRRRAEEYLAAHHRMDLDALVAALEDFDSEKELVFNDLSRTLIGGVVDFGDAVSLREVIVQAVEELCTGAQAPFHKMLILFDELGVYAESWCHNRMAAGNLAPQQLIEACDDKRGRVCFVGFVQRELKEFVKNFAVQEDFIKWSSRLPPESTYHLVSNLEEVIGKMLVKTGPFEQVTNDNSPTLRAVSRTAWAAQQKYQENWTEKSFYQTVTCACFPLHPLTTGLLCSFNFTHGSRTLISAVGAMVEEVWEQPVTVDGTINWVAPIGLVGAFEEDFKKQSTIYTLYEHALQTLGHNLEPLFYEVLKALFLFYEGRLKRDSRTKHAQVLARLVCCSVADVETALCALHEEHGVLRYVAANQEYNFSDIGRNPVELLSQLKRETANQEVVVVTDALRTLKAFDALTMPDSQAREFKANFAVEGEEWRLAHHFLDAGKLTPETAKRLGRAVDEKTSRGSVIYLIADDAAELSEALEHAQFVLDELAEQNFAHPLIIAVPRAPAAQIRAWIRLGNALYQMKPDRKLQCGPSYDEAWSRVKRELTDQLTAHLTQHSSVQFVLPKIIRPRAETLRNQPEHIADALFTQIFPFRPSSNSNVLKPSGVKANTVTAEIAKQLIVNELNFAGLPQEKQNVVKNVLLEGHHKWGLLNAQYRLQEPKNARVAQAWRLIGENVQEDSWTTFESLCQKLSAPPFGYDDYTMTLLLAAWIGFHKRDLGFKAGSTIIYLTILQEKLNKARDFLKWLRTGISLRHTGPANRRQAQEFLAHIQHPDASAQAQHWVAQTPQILSGLAREDELWIAINEQLLRLNQHLSQVAEVEKQLREHCEAAQKISDIPALLRLNNSLAKYANGASPNGSFVDTAQFISQRLATVAQAQACVSLQKIESYELERQQLEKNAATLHKAGLLELENLFTAALGKLEEDYRRLQTEKAEQPLAVEINSWQISNMPLRYYAQTLARIEEVLGQKPSPQIRHNAERKQREILEQAQKLRQWAADLPDRVSELNDLATANKLRDDLIRRESQFAGTLEANILARASALLTTKIKELEAQQQQAHEAALAEQRRVAEKDYAQTVTSRFAQITDAQQRFECLAEVVRHSRQVGLSQEQAQFISDLLWCETGV